MTVGTQYLLDQIVEAEMRTASTTLSKNAYFERFVPEQLLKDFDLGVGDIDAGVVDGELDGGIDSIYVFVNGSLLVDATELDKYKRNVTLTVYIVQTKYTGGFQELGIQRLITSLPELFQPGVDLDSLRSTYNQDLLGIMHIWHDAYTQLITAHPAVEFRCFYATASSEVHPNVQRLVTPLRSVVQPLYSNLEFTFEFLRAEHLVGLYHRQPSETVTLTTQRSFGSPGNAFIALVSLGDFYDFITDDHGVIINRYFESNVRDYQGDIEVNRGIRDSLQTADVDFWWLNNGITIIADETSMSGNDISLTNPQIVNGLQTSKELSDVFRSLPSETRQNDKRMILVRVLKPKNDEIRDRIITATNSQTRIPAASLRATDPIHRSIERYFESKGLYYDRRKSYQANRGKHRDKIISIGYLAQCVMAIVLHRPNDSRARPGNLLKDQGDYSQLFNDAFPLEGYIRCAQVTKRVEAFLRSSSAVTAANDKNNVKWHLAMFAVLVSIRAQRVSSASIAKFDVGNLTDSYLERCLVHVWEIYDSLSISSGSADRAAKSTDFVAALDERIKAINARRRSL